MIEFSNPVLLFDRDDVLISFFEWGLHAINVNCPDAGVFFKKKRQL